MTAWSDEAEGRSSTDGQEKGIETPSTEGQNPKSLFGAFWASSEALQQAQFARAVASPHVGCQHLELPAPESRGDDVG